MKVIVYVINKGTESQYFGLKNAEENMVLHSAPNNWKTEKGAKRWAERNGFEVVEPEEEKGGEKTMVKELKDCTCKELRETAKERNISGRWDMTKEQLIKAIKAVDGSEQQIKEEVQQEQKEVEVKEEQKVTEEVKLPEVQQEQKEEKKADKMKFVETVRIGTIVAYKLPDGTVKSAKVINKSQKNRKLKLETAYGLQLVVSFDDVIWVRYGTRWPKGIFELLKGNKKYEER